MNSLKRRFSLAMAVTLVVTMMISITAVSVSAQEIEPTAVEDLDHVTESTVAEGDGYAYSYG